MKKKITEFKIKFQNVFYKVRTIHLPGIGARKIAGERLQAVLLTDGLDSMYSTYVSDEAKWIDESIYYYVPEDILMGTDKEILEYVARNS